MREISAYLDELVRRLQARLGGRLAGVWLVGSGALGDLDPQRSDIDVQCATTERVSRQELERLAAAISHDALPCPVRGLEFVLYAQDDLAAADGPAFSLNLNTGRGMREHVGLDPAAEPRFWFTLDVAIARASGHPLAGTPPAALLPELPRPLILSALAESLRWYRGYDAAEAVLAACRAWAWVVEGRWLSKGQAAQWAVGRLEDPGPVERAIARRSDAGAPPPAADDVMAMLERAERAFAHAAVERPASGGLRQI